MAKKQKHSTKTGLKYSRYLRILIPPTIVFTVAVFLMSSVFREGLMSTHDAKWHTRRTIEMVAMLREGYFPVRWGLELDNHFGIPLFNFLYPLPYYITSIFQFLSVGLITSHKIIEAGPYILGALGFYFLLKDRSKALAVVISIIYALLPYHFLNIFVRGAIGEVMAISMFPWILVSLSCVDKKKRLNFLSPLPLALAILSHNFLGLLFLIFTLLSIGLVTKHKKIQLYNLLLSIGLSSFFLLPMILERGLLLSSVNNDFSFIYSDHFVYPKQLLYSKWDYWYSLPGPDDTMSFQLGFASIIAALSGLVCSLMTRFSNRRLNFYLANYLLAIYLMLSQSKWVWEAIPLMQSIQFPWRLLSFTTLLTPLIIYETIISVKVKINLKIILLLAILALGFYNVRNYRRPIRYYTTEEFMEIHRIFQDKTTTAFRGELVPKWAPNERYQPENNGRWPTKTIGISEGPTELVLIQESAGDILIETNAENERAEIIIYKNYFPSWRGVNIDSKELINLYPSEDGSILFNPAVGPAKYRIYLAETPLEKLANIITISSLFILAFLHYYYSKKTA